MLIFDESRITLKRGHTITEYIIAVNANTTSYDKLCEHLKISFAEARAIYDRIYNAFMPDTKKRKTQTEYSGG